MTMRWIGLCGALLGASMMGDALAKDDETTTSSMPFVDLRYRNATLDSDNYENQGHAHTLRLQLGYWWQIGSGFDSYVEGTRVWSLFGRQYDDTSGRYTPYPAEADPTSTELSSAWIGYHDQTVQLRLGRQYVRFDNNRFFSAAAWRQNPQTYDGFSARWTPHQGTTLTYDWLDQVNRTVGADFPDRRQRRWQLDANLLHLDQQLPVGALALYSYWVRNNTLAANSVKTQGGRWVGSQLPLYGDTRLSWTMEFATQRDFANNPTHFSLPYHLLDLTYGWSPISLRLGEEMLGGDRRNALNVAYGTAHSFNGWVGEFKIPKTGLRDRFGGVVGTLPWHSLGWQLLYHDFHSEGRALRYGYELDAGVLAKWSKRFTTELQFGSYRARGYGVDEHKLWLMAEYRYGQQAM